MPETTTSRAQTHRFFEPLLELNPSGSRWLPELLRAAPQGERLGEVVDGAGPLLAQLTLPGLEGRRTCFHYPVAAPAELTAWFIDHPDRLSWPESAELSREATVLRRALIHDDPPGSRDKAQRRARDLVPVRSAFAEEWWRFEPTFRPDCVLMTDKLVLTVVAASRELAPVSDWYPQRSVLVRGLEAARRLAGERRSGTLLLSDTRLAEGEDAPVRESLPAAAPHLDAAAQAELAGGYLGQLTWTDAAAAVNPGTP